MATQSHSPVSLPSFSDPHLLIDPPTGSVCQLSIPGDPPSGATSHNRKIPYKERNNGHAQGESCRHDATIDVLPDDVLLEIFDFCRENIYCSGKTVWEWHLLVHVCQRWRQIIFASPHRLNLQILCTYGTPVRKNLGIWPAFPIVIDFLYDGAEISPNDEDNIVAALEHIDRVCFFGLDVTCSQLEKIVKVMQESFPVLTRLHIFSRDGNAQVLPAEFLGGSAPRLRKILLEAIPFPTLPTLLLSTSDLVTLCLRKIPPTGYISPEAMVVALAAPPRLNYLSIGFQSATPHLDRMRPPPVTRAILPALALFLFNGAGDYLEDLISRIDGPRLHRIFVTYSGQPVDSQVQVAQLFKFFGRSVGPMSTSSRRARVDLFNCQVTFTSCRHVNYPCSYWRCLKTIISCGAINWQVSHLTQALRQSSVTLSTVVHLELYVQVEEEDATGELERMDYIEWLHLLRQFSTVRTLYVSGDLAGHIALALEDIMGEMVAEVLPSLDLICLGGLPAPFVEKFVAARRLSGRPVTVVDTKTEFDERLKSYVSK